MAAQERRAPEDDDAGRLKVLYIAPHVDGHDIGESLTAYQLSREMAEIADLTILALECTHGPALQSQIPNAEVFTFPEPAFFRRHERLRAMLRPNAFIIGHYAKRWIADALGKGRTFHVAHQLLPAAPRYPTVLRHFNLPYVIGSVGGALQTPSGFEAETGKAPLYTRLRALDAWRFRHDPVLRASYAGAALVLGVAPYMREVLKDLPIQRFEPFLGIGVDDVEPPLERNPEPGTMKLLHVGRAVRTKGLRDAVRALAHLKDLPGVTLTSIGDGEEIAICKAEAERLSVADRVTFRGKLARDAIEDYYRTSDVFIFPSFRESMGGVLHEAMRWSLPVITARAGGPDYIVDERCGLKADVGNPEQFSWDLAQAVRTLFDNPDLRTHLGAMGRRKLLEEDLWPVKAKLMQGLYRRILQ